MRLSILLVAVALFTFTGCASFNTPPSIAPLQAQAGEYELDPDHTTILWKVDHLGGLSKFVGRFDRMKGTLSFDPTKPENARIDIRIEAASVSTSVSGFSETIANKIFDAKDYPEIRFVSTGVTGDAQTVGTVKGELTMRGKTNGEVIRIKYNGTKINPLNGKETVGFAAEATINRSDYGATAWALFGVGDKIDLEIHTEFVKVN